MIAALRPDSLDLTLFFHVLGAMVLVGSLVAVLMALLLASRSQDGTDRTLRRFALRTLLFAAVPSFILMRVFAQRIASKEFPDGSKTPDWLGIGFIISDAGALLLIVTCILAWRATKSERTGGLARAALVLTGVMLVAFVVAMWAMTAKPGS